MIELLLRGYRKKDLDTLLKVFTTHEAGYWCMGEYDNPSVCQRSYARCPHGRVCKDITSAVNYIHHYNSLEK